MHIRVPLPDPGPLGAFISSFDIHLRSEKKSLSTRACYLGATTRLAGWLLKPAIPEDLAAEHLRGVPATGRDVKPVTDWLKVKQGHIKLYMVYLLEVVGYDTGYANNQYRAVQQFWRWYSVEEGVPNPMAGLSPPKPGDRMPPVIAVEQMAQLVKDAEGGRDFESRRDAALLRMFACSGARLAEITNLDLEDVEIHNRRARVVGKGDKERWVKFDDKAARALDRYLRLRARHRAAGLPALWLGVRRTQRMTPSGIRQVVSRRADRLGLDLYPHMFRHTFAHAWLVHGGAEGDLMELAGWDSPQMLRRYGRSARSARAQRAYDRIDVMGGV
jgi:integrase/recombinase XerD